MSSSIQTHSINHVRFGTESSKLLTDTEVQSKLTRKLDEFHVQAHTGGQTLFAPNGIQSIFIEPVDKHTVNVWSSAPGPDKFPIYTLFQVDKCSFRISVIKRTPLGKPDRDIRPEDIQTLEALLKTCLPH